MQSFEQLANKYGEDPETYKWEDLFNLLVQFNEVFEKAKADNEKEKADKIKRATAAVGGGTLRLRRKEQEGGVETALKEQRDPAAIQRRQSIRRAKSLRRVEKKEEGGQQNLNNLLNMLDKMKKTETKDDPSSNE
eukprot:TRINITY_DN8532_c0_g1_i1.p1 TRINITY_DN8532_c0_g1~~TRINITY_DN8532_c0_g1_i1.p1  ORF type:complete len:155 (-),score=69.02 TRINITY_DN8532_c0_g1_i1:73-477(-)